MNHLTTSASTALPCSRASSRSTPPRARDRQAAPRGAADALRLARRRPGPALQPREFRPWIKARRQGRQDPGPLRQGDPDPPLRHRRHDAGGPSRASRSRTCPLIAWRSSWLGAITPVLSWASGESASQRAATAPAMLADRVCRAFGSSASAGVAAETAIYIASAAAERLHDPFTRCLPSPRPLRPGQPPRTPRASGARALARLTGRVHAAAIRSIWMVPSR